MVDETRTKKNHNKLYTIIKKANIAPWCTKKNISNINLKSKLSLKMSSEHL